MSTSYICPLQQMDAALRNSWRTLLESKGFNPTLGPDWLQVVCDSTVDSAPAISVYVEPGADRSVRAVVPFSMARTRMAGIPMSVLQLATNRVSYHGELVTDGDATSVLRGFLKEAPPWDVFHASNVLAGSDTEQAIKRMAEESGGSLQVIPGDVSPYLPVAGSWDAYLASKGKKFRYKVRHRRDLLKDKPHELIWFGPQDDTATLLKDILMIESKSWKVADGMDIPSSARERRYHEHLLPFLAQQGTLLANVLYIERQPVAYNLCCNSRGWIGQLKTSFDDSFRDLSPGTVVIDEAIAKAFALQAREFDFLGHAAPHKLAWTASTRSHTDYFLFGTGLKARLVAALKRVKAALRAPTASADRVANPD